MRWFYNRTVEYINESYKNQTKLEKWHLFFKDINSAEPEWSKGTPFQIKKMAVKDAYKAYSTSISLLKKKLIDKFKLKFKKKNDPKCAMYIPKTAVSDKGVYHRLLGKMKTKEKINKCDYDCRLVNRGNDYYLTLPQKTTTAKVENQDVSDRIVAIDLGVRTFATFYSEETVGKIGINASADIIKLCLRLDKVYSEISKSKEPNQKKRLKVVSARIREKIRNKVDELHKKTAKFLTDNFDIIVLPKFSVSQMVIKGKKRITKKSVRNMLNLGFYRFREYMRSKCLELGKVLLEPSEAYTSKTQSWNGIINSKLGGSKWIGSEEERMDRDYNGARGIFIIAIMKIESQLSIQTNGVVDTP